MAKWWYTVVKEIVIEDVWWKYKASEDWVLKGISLQIEKGQFYGIMGPSGVGKSTLCLCLNGIIPQAAKGEFKGRVKIGGMDTSEDYISEFIGKVGLVSQDPDSQFIMMSVEDELVSPLENLRFSRDEITERIEWVADLVGIKHLLKKYPHELSGGQKQRIAIASFLAMRPEILVLDEPTSDLDPVGKESVFSIVESLRKETDLTIVMVEHDSEKLAKFADRIAVINDGTIILDDDTDHVFQEYEKLRQNGIVLPQAADAYLQTFGLKEDRLLVEYDRILNEFRNAFSQGKLSFTAPCNTILEKSGNEVIDFNDVDFHYPDGTKAAEQINLRIHDGEYVAIIGQNGSGKTTLAKLLKGLLKPTNGKVTVFGTDTSKVSATKITQVGYCFQNPDHQLSRYDVREELEFGPKNLKLEKDEIERRVDDVLNVIGLQNFANEYPFFLGKGQRRRLAVGTILTMQPKVVIVDEPTTGQDFIQSKEIMELLDRLNEKGRTIIVITHNMRLVAEHAKRTIIMHEGKIIADGPTSEVFSKRAILEQTHLNVPEITNLAIDLTSCANVMTVEQFLSGLVQS